MQTNGVGVLGMFGLLLLLLAVGPSRIEAGVQAPVADVQYPELESRLQRIGGKAGSEIRYGYDLMRHTARYFGPSGTLGKNSRSRMACANCHLEVGARAGGNSWTGTYAIYPQYRPREGKVQTLEDRINACFEHPMQGKQLPLGGREMRAIVFYFKWLGEGRSLAMEDQDDRLPPIGFPNRAADPVKGEAVFKAKCAQCHGEAGQGLLDAPKRAYIYPPLWGPESFITGSSMSRISLLARFIKSNMPFETTLPRTASLSEDEAWDVARFILIQPRPGWKSGTPYPNPEEKPFDFPIGPYADPFPQAQHLAGPFREIDEWYRKRSASMPKSDQGI